VCSLQGVCSPAAVAVAFGMTRAHLAFVGGIGGVLYTSTIKTEEHTT